MKSLIIASILIALALPAQAMTVYVNMKAGESYTFQNSNFFWNSITQSYEVCPYPPQDYCTSITASFPASQVQHMEAR